MKLKWERCQRHREAKSMHRLAWLDGVCGLLYDKFARECIGTLVWRARSSV